MEKSYTVFLKHDDGQMRIEVVKGNNHLDACRAANAIDPDSRPLLVGIADGEHFVAWNESGVTDDQLEQYHESDEQQVSYTVFCEDLDDAGSTVWIDEVDADNPVDAVDAAIVLCEADWNHVCFPTAVGVARGSLEILWDDQGITEELITAILRQKVAQKQAGGGAEGSSFTV